MVYCFIYQVFVIYNVLQLDWMQFGFGFNSQLFAQLTKFLISNACLKKFAGDLEDGLPDLEMGKLT